MLKAGDRSYQDELALSGKRLFFVRGTYIYIVIAISTLIAFLQRDIGPFSTPALDRFWFWLSLAVAATGAGIRIVTSGFAALGTSGRAKVAAEAAELNTTGPYSLVRNPLYLGRILNFTGLAMLSGSLGFAAVVLLAAVLIYERISCYEEQYLRGRFAAEYPEWAARVPALFPRFHEWVKPKYPFWWKRMIWREQNKVFLLATALFLTFWARLGFSPEALAADRMHWVLAFGLLVVIRFAIGGLKMIGYYRELS